ncbi:MAG: DUF4199 domain-containing protein [Bacteroidota bacterium]|jgi:hypothetical protein
MKFKFELKWGMLFIIAMIVWMIFEKLMGWHGPKIEQHPIYTNFYALVAILVYVLAFLDKRKNDRSKMEWRQGFVYGLGITLVVILLNPLNQWLVNYIISPEFFPNAINYAVENGKLSQEDAESYFSFENYLIQSSIGGLLMGTISSALIALFIQKKHPEILG